MRKAKHVLRVTLVALVIYTAGATGEAQAASTECIPVPPGPCECTDGPCCDACHYFGPDVVCASDVEELACLSDDGSCGAVVTRRTAARYCSGASAGCEGAVGPFGPWETLGRCSVETACVPERPLCRPAPECSCLARCDDSDPCTVDTCDEAGGCRHQALDCDDGLACTPDRCDGGVCVHGAPDCNDGNECTVDVCEAGAGCRHASREEEPCIVPGGLRGTCRDSACCVPDCEGRECGPDGCGGTCGECDDGDNCTIEECRADGTCSRRATCDDGVECTYDICLGGYCFHTPDDAACEDGRPCSADWCAPTGCFTYEVACACADDEAEDNDSQAAARAVAPDVPVTGLRAVYGDDDWWWLELAAGSELRVEVSTGSPQAATNLELTVKWDCGQTLDARTEGDSLVATGTSAFAGPAYIGVRTPTGGLCLDYDLLVTVVPATFPEVTCNVRCPYLDGYEAACNAQNHCEYARPAAEGWEKADVLIWVPPGSFPFGRGGDFTVTFAHGYWVDKYEATGGAYAAFLDERGSNLCRVDRHGMAVGCLGYCSNSYWGSAFHSPTGGSQCRVAWDEYLGEAWIPAACQDEPHGPLTTCRDHPVGDVTWFGAREFCHWRGAELCSESQWERAGKGTGQQSYPWGDAPVPWGPDWDPDIACVQVYPGYDVTLEFAMHRGASPVGCHHLAGNVEEWVLDTGPGDLSAGIPPDLPRDGSPWLAGDPDIRVVRGRPTETDPFLGREPARAWVLYGTDPPVFDWNVFAESGPEIGFRCCRTRKCVDPEGLR